LGAVSDRQMMAISTANYACVALRVVATLSAKQDGTFLVKFIQLWFYLDILFDDDFIWN
jgi:hypothetical protein